MLTCKEASFLVSKNLDTHLSWHDRVVLRVHFLRCKICRSYARDINQLHELMRNHHIDVKSILPEHIKLSDLSRGRIKQALDKAIHQSN